MTGSADAIIDLYVNKHQSVQRIADTFSLSTSRVYRMLDKAGISRRSISEAISDWHTLENGKEPFLLKKRLSVSEEKLKIAGVMLYWGEGSKKNNKVAFTNSDPEMIVLFLRFLRKICGISETRLRLTLHFYEDQDPEALKRFWSKLTDIPLKYVHKPHLHKKPQGTYKTLSKYGTVAVSYSDKRLLDIINGWIREYCSLS